MNTLSDKELIALHTAVQQGQEFPDVITETEYKHIRQNKELYPEWLIAFVGFGLSYSGKYFGGYARDGSGRNYCKNAKGTLLKKHSGLKDVKFTNLNYSDVQLPVSSIIYCDIPYKGTTKYSTGTFNHNELYEWCLARVTEGHNVLVSEYKHNLPKGWRIVWEHLSKKDIRNKEGVQEQTIEIVMTPC